MNKKLAALVIVLFVVVALLAYVKILDALTTDDHRIRSIVYKISNAAEERDLRTISSYLHSDFHSEIKNIGRDEMLAMLRYAFTQYRTVRARFDSLTVDILDENTAEARFIATVRASRSGAPPGEDILEFCGSDRFVVTFAKEEGDWKVLKAGILRSTAD